MRRNATSWVTLMLALGTAGLMVAAGCSRKLSNPTSPGSSAAATPTGTATNTFTPVNTNTSTPTHTSTSTHTPTPTQTPTNTNTPTGPTNTFTHTPTPTETPTPTSTPTVTPTPTQTSTATQTPTPTPPPPPPPEVIENVEDGDNQVLLSQGRNGFWFATSDLSQPATYLVDTMDGAAGTANSMRVSMGPVTQWANVGFNFTDPEADYDTTPYGYTGITFYVKRNAGTAERVRVGVPDGNTAASGDVHLTAICLSTSWQAVTIFFDRMNQEGWSGSTGPINKAALRGFRFLGTANETIDLWVDEIAFTTAAPPPPMGSFVVDNMEDGDTAINPNLTGQPAAGSFGWNSYIGDPGHVTGLIPPVQCGGYLSVFGAVALGTLTDAGDFFYPAYNVTVDLWDQGSPPDYFDASAFTGVRYWINNNTDPAPNVTLKFYIPIDETTATCCGGTCTTGCWDHFTANITATRGLGWTQMDHPFSTLAQEGWGTPANPTTFSGDNLTSVLQLQWSNSSNNTAGTYNIDFKVDNIEFY